MSWIRNTGLLFTIGSWKMKKRKRFVNTIAPGPMPVRYVRNLQRCGAFIEALTNEKLKMTFKKIITQLAIDRIFSSRICKSLYDVKPKAQSEHCASYCAIGN
jgi:hypothetical protein